MAWRSREKLQSSRSKRRRSPLTHSAEPPSDRRAWRDAREHNRRYRFRQDLRPDIRYRLCEKSAVDVLSIRQRSWLGTVPPEDRVQELCLREGANLTLDWISIGSFAAQHPSQIEAENGQPPVPGCRPVDCPTGRDLQQTGAPSQSSTSWKYAPLTRRLFIDARRISFGVENPVRAWPRAGFECTRVEDGQ